MADSAAPEAVITEHGAAEIDRVNQTGRSPVVFIHGMWLLPSSWDRWAARFDEAGYASLTPGWPDDPNTVAEANADPEVLAHKTIGQLADHFAAVMSRLTAKPAVIGHSFGGLLAQIIAGRGPSAATVAIDAAPFRGVLPLPLSSLKSAKPVLGNPRPRAHHRQRLGGGRRDRAAIHPTLHRIHPGRFAIGLKLTPTTPERWRHGAWARSLHMTALRFSIRIGGPVSRSSSATVGPCPGTTGTLRCCFSCTTVIAWSRMTGAGTAAQRRSGKVMTWTITPTIWRP